MDIALRYKSLFLAENKSNRLFKIKTYTKLFSYRSLFLMDTYLLISEHNLPPKHSKPLQGAELIN